MKVEKGWALEDEIVSWFVVVSRSANAQKRWVKSVESMSEAARPASEYQYPPLTTVVCAEENVSWSRIRRENRNVLVIVFIVWMMVVGFEFEFG